MYSIVLLAAMTSGGDVAAHGHGGCGGCGGGSGFCGGLFKSHGCGGCGGGCEGGCGGGHGFCGGLFKCFHRSHGCGCEAPAPVCGCCGAEPAPVCGCTGGEVTVTDGDAVKEEGDEEEKDEETKVSAPAKLIVTLPAGAKLSIDGVVTKSTSARRVFVSPKLAAGKVYTYTLTTEINNKVVSKSVEIRAGATTTVQLNVATPAVASR